MTADFNSEGALEKVLSYNDTAADEENKKLAPLLPEIDLITNQNIVSFVRAVLLKAPDAFWSIPSTFTSEDQRPPDELLEGGNVLHTKRVVQIARILGDGRGLEVDELDVLIAAAILHDITKAGVSNEQTEHDPMHPYTVDFIVELLAKSEPTTFSEDVSSSLWVDETTKHIILRLVRCSEGLWSPIPETVPMTPLEWLLADANLIASSLHRIIDPAEKVKYWRWIQNTS